MSQGFLSRTRSVYLETRKRHDQLFNTYVMRPLAASVVAMLEGTRVTPDQLTLVSLFVFAAGAVVLAGARSFAWSCGAVAILELSYLFDCADGMLARRKKIASQVGHLFDFFTDETKATMLGVALGVRLWRVGGYGVDGRVWPPGSERFLLAGIACVAVIGSAVSLTSFVRRPELSGKETPVEAHYESVDPSRSFAARVLSVPRTFLQFLNHYPSHLYVFAAVGRLDVFFWIYLANNLLYLGLGWLGLLRRFGRFQPRVDRSE